MVIEEKIATEKHGLQGLPLQDGNTGQQPWGQV